MRRKQFWVYENIGDVLTLCAVVFAWEVSCIAVFSALALLLTVPPLRRWRRAYDLTRRLRGCGRYGLLQKEPRREEPLEMRTARPSRHKSGAKHAAGQGLALF